MQLGTKGDLGCETVSDGCHKQDRDENYLNRNSSVLRKLGNQKENIIKNARKRKLNVGFICFLGEEKQTESMPAEYSYQSFLNYNAPLCERQRHE